MADNSSRTGFRLVRMRSGFAHASQEEAFCVSGQSFDVTGGAQNVSLRPGDPIVRLASGGVALAPGTEGTPGDILGVVCGIKQYMDPVRNAVTALGNAVPSDLAYGTQLDLQTKVYYIPAETAVWAIQVDDIVNATKAAYQLLVGNNCNHVLSAATGLSASPKLKISTAAITATLQWRIIGLGSDTYNTDYAGANVELYVTCNRPQMQSGAGTAWQGI